MSGKQSIFAKAIANYDAKKAKLEASQHQAQPTESSPERGTVIPNKEGEENKQERRNLAPSLKPTEQASPVRVQPRPKNKLQGITEAARTSVERLREQQEPVEKVPKRKARFEERYRRITTYLENDVYEKVQELHEKGEIDRINNLVNTAVKLYLRKFYGYGHNQ